MKSAAYIRMCAKASVILFIVGSILIVAILGTSREQSATDTGMLFGFYAIATAALMCSGLACLISALCGIIIQHGEKLDKLQALIKG